MKKKIRINATNCKTIEYFRKALFFFREENIDTKIFEFEITQKLYDAYASYVIIECLVDNPIIDGVPVIVIDRIDKQVLKKAIKKIKKEYYTEDESNNFCSGVEKGLEVLEEELDL